MLYFLALILFDIVIHVLGYVFTICLITIRESKDIEQFKDGMNEQINEYVHLMNKTE